MWPRTSVCSVLPLLCMLTPMTTEMLTERSAPSQSSAQEPLLDVDNLAVVFQTDQGVARAVDGISFSLDAGATLALVGESGCGKSVTALALLRLIPSPPGRIVSGKIRFDGQPLRELSEEAMRRIRGDDISMIFQEPMTSLNPVFRIGAQIGAVLRLHRGLSREEAGAATVELLRRVGIPEAERRMEEYPHQMSGGMLQRIMIAMALACDPKLLIADEPTTALDVTIQAQILALLRELRNQTRLATLLITHDLAVVAETADTVAVMYAGKIVETAPVTELFSNPCHPYTQGLFASLPGVNRPGKHLATIEGVVPPITAFPPGCRFHPRCPHAMAICRELEPALVCGTAPHPTACFLHQAAGEIPARTET